jgi:SAM-dependent methyltransferase
MQRKVQCYWVREKCRNGRACKAKKIENFEPIVADITNFSVNNKFDVAVSLFHVISYLTNNNQLVECFNTVNNHLNEKGIFIFDVWYTPAVYMQKPETRVKELVTTQFKELE